MSRPLGDLPRKNPYRHIAGRMSMTMGGMINIIQDIDEEIWYTGFMLTIENLHEGGPKGCRTSYCEDDAYTELATMAD